MKYQKYKDQVEISFDLPWNVKSVKDKNVVILAPRSHWAKEILSDTIKELNVVGMIDDFDQSEMIPGVPVWTNFKFLNEKDKIKDLCVIDFLNAVYTSKFSKNLCDNLEIERIDFTEARASLDYEVVYQTPKIRRDETKIMEKEFLSLFDLLDDEHSARTLASLIKYRFQPDRSHFWDSITSFETEYFGTRSGHNGFRIEKNEAFCDVGAHVGSTVYKFLEASNFQFENIYAFEPDKFNFKRLTSLKALPFGSKIKLFNAAVSDSNGEIMFNSSGTMGSNIFAGGTEKVKMLKLDDNINKLSFLKIDTEGNEVSCLRGAKNLIKEFKPKIAVASYHYAKDIVEIINAIKEIDSGYNIRIRHHSNHLVDTVVYASYKPFSETWGV